MISRDEMTALAAEITELAYDARRLEILAFQSNIDEPMEQSATEFYGDHTGTNSDVGNRIDGYADENGVIGLVNEFEYIVPKLTAYTKPDLAPYDTIIEILEGAAARLAPTDGYNPDGTDHGNTVARIGDLTADWRGAFAWRFRDVFCESVMYVGINQAHMARELAEIVRTHRTIVENARTRAGEIATATRDALAVLVGGSGGDVDGWAIAKSVTGLALNIAALVVSPPTGAAGMTLTLLGLLKNGVETVETVNSSIDLPDRGGSLVDHIVGGMNTQLVMLNMATADVEEQLGEAVSKDLAAIFDWYASAETGRFLVPPDVMADGMPGRNDFEPDSLP